MIANSDDLEVAEVKCTPGELTLTWQNSSYSVYSALWLRDNDPLHRDAVTGERLITLLDLPREPRLRAAEPQPSGHLTVTWEDGVISVFALGWLRSYDRGLRIASRPTRMPWLGQPAAGFASCDYTEWMRNPAGREDWLYYAGRDGLAFLRNLPIEEGTVTRIADRIGDPRKTNRGCIFEVRGRADVPMHTEQPYRDPVPAFALLHCLSSETGQTLFVDGMAAAGGLQARDSEAFKLLCQVPILYRFHDAQVDFTAERPMIELDCSGEFRAIYYDDRSLAPLPLRGPRLDRFYDAYRRLAQRLDQSARRVKCALQAGDLVLIDNTRILHGHTGLHHLQGCCLDAGELYSALAVLTRERNSHRHE